MVGMVVAAIVAGRRYRRTISATAIGLASALVFGFIFAPLFAMNEPGFIRGEFALALFIVLPILLAALFSAWVRKRRLNKGSI